MTSFNVRIVRSRDVEMSAYYYCISVFILILYIIFDLLVKTLPWYYANDVLLKKLLLENLAFNDLAFNDLEKWHDTCETKIRNI